VSVAGGAGVCGGAGEGECQLARRIGVSA
jgi:hypothetical protein